MHKTWVLVSEDLVTFSSHPATQQHEGTNTCDVCRLSSHAHTHTEYVIRQSGVHMARSRSRHFEFEALHNTIAVKHDMVQVMRQ